MEVTGRGGKAGPFQLALLVLLIAPTGLVSQAMADKRAVAVTLGNTLRQFVSEHADVIPGPMVLDTGMALRGHTPPHAYSRAAPFSPDNARALASEVGWRIGSFEDQVECNERCLLRDNAIVFNVSEPEIEGDRAVVSIDWSHNNGGVIRPNSRVVEMVRSQGQKWEVGRLLTCIHAVGGGPCSFRCCGYATLPGGTSSANGQLPFLLPEHPPDSIPADAWEDDPYWRAPLDVFAVTFRPGLTREEKTRLVVEVGGIELVGGAPFSHDKWEDGMYLVRIRDDGTMNPLLKAIDALNEHPDVISALMLVPMGVNSANQAISGSLPSSLLRL